MTKITAQHIADAYGRHLITRKEYTYGKQGDLDNYYERWKIRGRVISSSLFTLKKTSIAVGALGLASMPTDDGSWINAFANSTASILSPFSADFNIQTTATLTVLSAIGAGVLSSKYNKQPIETKKAVRERTEKLLIGIVSDTVKLPYYLATEAASVIMREPGGDTIRGRLKTYFYDKTLDLYAGINRVRYHSFKRLSDGFDDVISKVDAIQERALSLSDSNRLHGLMSGISATFSSALFSLSHFKRYMGDALDRATGKDVAKGAVFELADSIMTEIGRLYRSGDNMDADEAARVEKLNKQSADRDRHITQLAEMGIHIKGEPLDTGKPKDDTLSDRLASLRSSSASSENISRFS